MSRPRPHPHLPRALPSGGTIAFISPSERLQEALPSPTARGAAVLESRGYKVKTFWTHEDPATTTVASHIGVRKAEILAAFADADVDAIICMVGGTTLTELMPAFLRDPSALDILRKNPKILVGYSDITHLHWLLHSQTGLRTFYGPTVVPELGEAGAPADALNFNVDHLLRAITVPGEPIGPVPRSKEYRPLLPPHFADPTSEAPAAYAPTPAWRWLRRGRAEGRIFGGCLPVVVRVDGVQALRPDWLDKIIFLETSMAESDSNKGIPLRRIRAQLADLVARGIFDEVAGLVLGRSFGYDTDEERAELEQLVREVVVDNPWVVNKGHGAFPVLTGVDFGHTNPMITLPMDALVRLDSEKDEFSVLEAGVC